MLGITDTVKSRASSGHLSVMCVGISVLPETRAQGMPCRPVLDFHRFYSLTHAGGSTYSNSAPIHSRRFHTHTQSPRIPIPPYWPHVCRNRRGIAVGLHRRPPIHISRPSAIHKKLQSPQSHISQPIHCSPCLTDPHAPRILHKQTIFPYVLRGSAIQSASSKNPTSISERSAIGPANSAPAKSSKYYMPATGGGAGTSCAYVFTAMVTLSRACARPWQHPFPGHAFDETSADGFGGSTLQPDSLKFPAPARGHGRRRRRCDVNVDVRGGGNTCMCYRA